MAEHDVSPDRAFELLSDAGAAARLPTERIVASSALGRVLRENLASLVDRPPADDSALDGYAAFASVTRGASEDRPVRLAVIGESHAGAPYLGAVKRGEAVYVATGAYVPSGEEKVGVVGVEHASREGDDVLLYRPASETAVRVRARDLRAGETYLRAGAVLGPLELGTVAGMGHAHVEVSVRPRIAIVSTGDELVQPGRPLQPGAIYESNLPTLVAAAARTGADVTAGRVDDDPDELAVLLSRLAEEGFDLVLTIGGISMGEREPVRGVMERSGEVVFRRVTARPGGPLTFFRHAGTPVLALPGNPVSSYVCFQLFARAYLNAATGSREPLPYTSRLKATLQRDLRPDTKTVFHRATLRIEEGIAVVDPYRDQSSAVSRSLLEGDCLVVAPPAGVTSGSLVDVIPLPKA